MRHRGGRVLHGTADHADTDDKQQPKAPHV